MVLRPFHRSVTKRKRAVKNPAHKRENRQSQDDFDQSKTGRIVKFGSDFFPRSFVSGHPTIHLGGHQLLFFVRRKVFSSTRRSCPPSFTFISKATSFNSQLLERLSEGEASRTA